MMAASHDHPTPPMTIARLRSLPLLLALTSALAPACATDAATASVPRHLDDASVQIAGRRVQLPPGDWTLVQSRDFHGAQRLRDVDVLTAWLVDLDHGQPRAVIQLSLPLAEMTRAHPVADVNPCTARDGVLRGDYSHSRSEMECLAVFGHHDLGAILRKRSPRTANWLARQGSAPIADGVEFAYSHRAGTALGRVAMYFPARYFASDDDAAQWARTIREVFEPLVERPDAQARLPALPRAVEADAAQPSASAP